MEWAAVLVHSELPVQGNRVPCSVPAPHTHPRDLIDTNRGCQALLLAEEEAVLGIEELESCKTQQGPGERVLVHLCISFLTQPGGYRHGAGPRLPEPSVIFAMSIPEVDSQNNSAAVAPTYTHPTDRQTEAQTGGMASPKFQWLGDGDGARIWRALCPTATPKHVSSLLAFWVYLTM